MELLEQVKKLSAADKHNEVLELLDDKTLQKQKNSELYAYSARSLWHKGEFDKAIADCDTAIELDNKYALAFLLRGNSWDAKGQYDKAIEDYTKAIELNPEYANAFNNRGVSWKNKGEYDKAIEDYTKAIELNTGFSLAYRNMGDVFYIQGNYEKAIADYNKAIELSSSQKSYLEEQIKLAKTKLGEVVSPSTDEKAKQKTLNFLLEVIQSISNKETQEKLRFTGGALIDTLNKIRKHTVVNLTQPVAHYTKLKVADILVSGKAEAKFRYYNVVYMNDPEEGKILLDYLKNKKILAAFNQAAKGDENNVYLGSFMLAAKDGEKLAHEDDLVMWRTYGKDEQKNEAMGCSLVIDNYFFDKGDDYIQPALRAWGNEKGQETEPEIVSGQTLYKVIYYNKRQAKFENDKDGKIKKDIDELKKQLLKLISYNKGGSGDISKAISSLVYRFLAELRYMIKSADYAVENEFRIIQYRTTDSADVQIDDNGGQWLPRRLYIESSKPFLPSLRKIILGPKAPNREQWIYLEAAMRKRGLKMELLYSDCKFQ